MAVSRVEKFSEYRKSIISDGAAILKTPIDTSLTREDSNITNLTISEQDINDIKKLKRRKYAQIILIAAYFLSVLLVLLIVGIKLF